ncbi:hypothetical protein LQ948_15575 [Jiella sp. MQZ9-1]|uniref:Uncharacterized protein n=1 Tax=Jiella flava TaxID=2816857 RepID=A0A939JWZ6_9HYPH|nr:hypothetical protein [Jiella flava]MBO0664054.1 hypothetical protein [Jiella flava]MCD2472626.1 hypothetical protein [Jiella flava]
MGEALPRPFDPPAPSPGDVAEEHDGETLDDVSDPILRQNKDVERNGGSALSHPARTPIVFFKRRGRSEKRQILAEVARSKLFPIDRAVMRYACFG